MKYVYLLECSDNDETVYKIGITKYENIQKRIRGLQTGNKDEIKVVSQFLSKYPTKLETTLHNRYNQNRCKKGEWFRLELNDVVKFKESCEKCEKNFDILQDNYFFKNNKI